MQTMQTVTIDLECDVMFSEEGELEVFLYMGDSHDHSVFKFNLNDIIAAYVDMFTLPGFGEAPPYIRHSDTEARDSIYNMLNTLKSGVEYIDELQNKYLDNEPNDKDIVE